MSNLIIVGIQWGDEGKGKIVDYLSDNADFIVRFQGGNNAGHTLLIDKEEFKLSLLPSGIIRKNKVCIIGNGVVLDPFVFLEEVQNLRKRGVKINKKNLIISENINLILPIHVTVDLAREKIKGNKKIGTTGRGIGPTYEDKIGRRGIRLSDLKYPEILLKKVNDLTKFHNHWIVSNGFKKISSKKILKMLTDISDEITQFMDKTWKVLKNANEKNKNVLFEGAQGIMLDIDHGTYPYVTSSNTLPSQAFIGSGFYSKTSILGVIKAYTTRVGSGPFPTEESGNINKKMIELGKEFGTVTGRKRRCGWFDSIMVRQACMISGVNYLVLTKLDVLDDFKKIKICIGYKLNNKKIDFFPSNEIEQNHCIPQYEILEGWEQSTYGISNIKDLPKKAIKYIKRIEELIGLNIVIISTGPERKQTIVKKKLF